jgi:hypothetical protein
MAAMRISRMGHPRTRYYVGAAVLVLVGCFFAVAAMGLDRSPEWLGLVMFLGPLGLLCAAYADRQFSDRREEARLHKHGLGARATVTNIGSASRGPDSESWVVEVTYEGAGVTQHARFQQSLSGSDEMPPVQLGAIIDVRYDPEHPSIAGWDTWHNPRREQPT